MHTAKITAAAQVSLSVIFLAGYFGMLAAFLFGIVHVAPVWRDQLTALIGVLTGGVMLILQFWFSRQRPPDPAATGAHKEGG